MRVAAGIGGMPARKADRNLQRVRQTRERHSALRGRVVPGAAPAFRNRRGEGPEAGEAGRSTVLNDQDRPRGAIDGLDAVQPVGEVWGGVTGTQGLRFPAFDLAHHRPADARAALQLRRGSVPWPSAPPSETPPADRGYRTESIGAATRS